jgi:hypothetical protein
LKSVSVKNKILVCLMMAILITGCGLKANPVPPAPPGSQEQSEQKLASSADGNAVVLIWRLQNSARKISYVNIERSELGSAGNICRDCPRTFRKIGQLPVSNVKQEKNEYRFADSLAEKGKIYSYRLRLCDEAGVCQESKTVEIDFK